MDLSLEKRPRPALLVILDGFGMAPFLEGNGIAAAKMPVMQYLWCNFPHCSLLASGDAVGLSYGEIGNSEVGHTSIGTGRVVYEKLPRINRAIQDKTFFQNAELLESIEHARKNNGTLHLMGIFSPGGVHGHMEHLFALLELCKEQNFSKVAIHLITDGRDSNPQGMPLYLEKFKEKMGDLAFEGPRIVSVIGRYYAMDRDNRWDRTEMAYENITQGSGDKYPSIEELIQVRYSLGETDEFIKASVVVNDQNQEVVVVNDGDSVIFWNFRPDRAKQITTCFLDGPGFEHFVRKKTYSNIYFVEMADYELAFSGQHIAFKKEDVKNALPEVLSKAGLTQLHIAETEKYAHVTFFFSGGKEDPMPGEGRVLVPSPKVATYDLKPEMSAMEIAEKVLHNIEFGTYDFIVMNFANADMVGHTGKMAALKLALEKIDSLMCEIVEKATQFGGMVFVTADHGNAEEKTSPITGLASTEHTTNPVPFIVIHPNFKKPEGENCIPLEGPEIPQTSGILADVAPTILDFLNIQKPDEMTGTSLRNALY